MLIYQKRSLCIPLAIFYVFLLPVCIILIACSNKEGAATKMYNEATSLLREGKEDRAVIVYERLVKKYPETRAAVDANQFLFMRDNVNKLLSEMEKVDAKIAKQTLLSTVRETIATSLKLFKLDNGRFPIADEGLKVLTIATRHDGTHYIPKACVKYIDYFIYLSFDGQDYELTLKD